MPKHQIAAQRLYLTANKQAQHSDIATLGAVRRAMRPAASESGEEVAAKES
ncbi:hypothetical protein AAG604_13275 [Citromicrobium bathyomarinum]